MYTVWQPRPYPLFTTLSLLPPSLLPSFLPHNRSRERGLMTILRMHECRLIAIFGSYILSVYIFFGVGFFVI